MPLIPNFLEQMVMIGLNQAPGPLLDLFGAVGFRAIVAAINLGLFEALAEEPQTAGELACRLKTNERATLLLLNALEALGYVKNKGGRFKNTPMTTRWMLGNAPSSFADGFRYWGTVLNEIWPYLESSIQSGEPPVDLYQWMEERPDTLRDFQALTMAWAHHAAKEVITRVKLSSPEGRLLDVGGGHGAYSVAFCRRYPSLFATIFDLPGAVEVGREIVQAEGLTDQIAFQAGNFWEDEMGQGYDVTLLFNIFHAFSPEQNQTLLRKAAATLRPGGTLIIMEQFAGRAVTPIAHSCAQILGLNFFHLMGGQIYPFAEMKTWLKATGFARIHRLNLLLSPGHSLVVVHKNN